MVKHLICILVLLLGGCAMFDDDMPAKPNERGYVHCGDENRMVVCQPGTYCSSPIQAVCTEGCVSDANCLQHENCFKEEQGDRVGVCIPTASGTGRTY